MNNAPPGPPLHLVIAGASGFIGQQLVPRLRKQGHELLLIGRDPQKLQSLFPGTPHANYDSWSQQAQGYDAVINLAVINNDRDADPASIQAVNVELPVLLATAAKEVRIPRFIQMSSVHALDPKNTAPYAKSKREAATTLRTIDGIDIRTLHLPLVWGDAWPGQLAFLGQLPRALALAAFKPLAALKPTVHVDCVLDVMLTNASGSGTQHVVASNVDDNPYYKAFSALIDYGFALTILIGFWWLLLFIAAWIRISTPGPAIFAQERVGKHGRIFTCYKFRTMAVGTRQAGTHEVSSASITTAGAFLRRTKLDELPQVINLLKGQLRLVGPRPGLPVQEQLYNARQAMGVFAIKPGITGWAQIHDVDMSDPEKLARWDADYIAMRGLLMDLKIIVATGIGRGKGDRILSKT